MNLTRSNMLSPSFRICGEYHNTAATSKRIECHERIGKSVAIT